MKRTPVIGISSTININKDEDFLGFETVSVSMSCVNSVKNAGALPIVLPLLDDKTAIEDLVRKTDALLLTGGHDVNPLLWGEEPYKKLKGINPKRDYFDYCIIEAAYAQNKPIMGICRGCQILNVYFGGSLWQDIDEREEFYIKHNQNANYDEVTHSIHLEKDSSLLPILGESILVNSYHHMAIKRLADGFRITAKAPDGIVEMIEHFDGNFMLGVQWHPELLSAKNEKMQHIFNYFVSKIDY